MSGSPVTPTAHYTGQVWARNGLSHPELQTREGRILFEAVRPITVASHALGGPTLEPYLLARHKAIDLLLEREIEAGTVSQVIEVAAGLSARGWRMRQRFGDRITYLETDLPAMAARKRAALERMGVLSEHHRVVELDALADSGPRSLPEVAGGLDRGEGLAIVTEGLLGYLPHDAVLDIWRRFATALTSFSAGRYVSDLHTGEIRTPQVRAFSVLLSAFVRGRVHLHFGDPPQARAALLDAGFGTVSIRRADTIARSVTGPGSHLAHVLLAQTSSSQTRSSTSGRRSSP